MGLPALQEFRLSKVPPVYVVDDEPGVRGLLVDLCEDRGLACRAFANGEEFLDALDDLEPGCVLLDMRLPQRSGLQVQAEMKSRGRAFPVIAITGYADVDMAVESMRIGAVDFLEKPFDTNVLFDAVDRGLALLGEPRSGDGATRNDPGSDGLNR
jgi:two-component system response regulator FixJ